MSYLKVKGYTSSYTMISNAFIDKYMVTSGSSHLKTYILLQRLLGDIEKEISISNMADILDCSESDVLRSLKHWEKKGLMKLEFDDENILISVELIEIKEEDGNDLIERKSSELMAACKMPVSEVSLHPVAETSSNNELSSLLDRSVDYNRIASVEEFDRFMFIAEQYIGGPISRTDCEKFAWMYNKLGFSTTLLEYLVEYCVTNGHKNVRYMETIAIDWHEKNISTVEQARLYTPLHNKNVYAVMKALGLGGRSPAPSERKIIDGWFQNYGFSLDIIIEACNRTMVSIHEPNLNYIESILERWKKAGIENMEQLKALDDKFQKQKKDEVNDKQRENIRKTPTSSFARKPGAQFHDFEQRKYDYNALLKEINGNVSNIKK